MPLRCMLHYANTSHMPLRVFYLNSYLIAESLDQVLAHTLFFIPFTILILVVKAQPTVGYYLGLVLVTLLCLASLLIYHPSRT
jgi:hypothetical protein